MELIHKHCKLEGNDIRQRESGKQGYFTVRLKARKHNELFRGEHFTSVYVTVPGAEGLFMFDSALWPRCIAMDSSSQCELLGLNSSCITTQDYQVADYFRMEEYQRKEQEIWTKGRGGDDKLEKQVPLRSLSSHLRIRESQRAKLLRRWERQNRLEQDIEYYAEKLAYPSVMVMQQSSNFWVFGQKPSRDLAIEIIHFIDEF